VLPENRGSSQRDKPRNGEWIRAVSLRDTPGFVRQVFRVERAVFFEPVSRRGVGFVQHPSPKQALWHFRVATGSRFSRHAANAEWSGLGRGLWCGRTSVAASKDR
jgi:hypothetical protein